MKKYGTMLALLCGFAVGLLLPNVSGCWLFSSPKVEINVPGKPEVKPDGKPEVKPEGKPESKPSSLEDEKKKLEADKAAVEKEKKDLADAKAALKLQEDKVKQLELAATQKWIKVASWAAFGIGILLLLVFAASIFYPPIALLRKPAAIGGVVLVVLWAVGLVLAWLVPYLMLIAVCIVALGVLITVGYLVALHNAKDKTLTVTEEAFAMASNVADQVKDKSQLFTNLLSKADELNADQLKSLRDKIRAKLPKFDPKAPPVASPPAKA